MTETLHAGALIRRDGTGVHATTPWGSRTSPLMGSDLDLTCLAWALLDHVGPTELREIPADVDTNDLGGLQVRISDKASLSLHIHPYHVSLSEHAAVETQDPEFERLGQSHLDLVSIHGRWEAELDPTNVSQGAYVSEASIEAGRPARTALHAQRMDGTWVWPPRADGGLTFEPMHAQATVLSWTRLSGGGAPSEFALRADLLGGIRTVLVQFDEGPRGVFLVADEIDENPHIGLSVGFVLRRIYGQEGRTIRGLKAHWSP